MKLPRINADRLISYALFVFSGVILAASFVITSNVQVLKDWTLRVPASEIHAGDTVTLVSEYTKLRDVTGKSVRYIECQNKMKAYVRYPLNEAVANRASGTGGTGIVIKVPNDIPDVPTTCKFTIAITYDVYPWKKVNHSKSSDSFKLLAKRDEPQSVSATTPLQPTSPDQAGGSNMGQSVVAVESSTKTTTKVTTSQPDNSQQTAMPDGSPTAQDAATLQPEPERVDDRTTLGRLPVVGGLFNAIGL